MQLRFLQRRIYDRASGMPHPWGRNYGYAKGSSRERGLDIPAPDSRPRIIFDLAGAWNDGGRVLALDSKEFERFFNGS